jgi:hypothetical protein|nr:MAG TPA: hypothetical protein [Bacteriophage sp.]
MSNVVTFKTFVSSVNATAAKAYEAAVEQYEHKAHIRAGVRSMAGVEVVAFSGSRAAAMKPEIVAIVKDGASVAIKEVGSRSEALSWANAEIEALILNTTKEEEMSYSFYVDQVPTMVQRVETVRAGKFANVDSSDEEFAAELDKLKSWARTICTVKAGESLPVVGKVDINIRRVNKGSVRIVAKNGTLTTALINSPLGRETVARHGFVAYKDGIVSVLESIEVLIDWMAGINTEGVKLVDALKRKPGGVVVVKAEKNAPAGIKAQNGDLLNTSPDTSWKLGMPVGEAMFISRKSANTMVAVNHPEEAGKYISVYDMKKSIARGILNPDLDTKVSIGVRKMAVLLSVTDEDGNKVKTLEQAKGHPLAMNLGGGACYGRKELIQQYGTMRIVSFHHAKGVVTNVAEIDALVDYLGVDVISPMLKSKMVGVAHAIMGGGLSDFMLRLMEDEGFRATANTAIALNSKSVNVDGLTYTFALIDEEIYVSDFYSLQGHKRVGAEVSVNDKIQGVEVEAPEMTLMNDLLSELKAGDTTYSPVVRLLEMKQAGLVEAVSHSAEGGVLLADQMIRQYGDSLFKSFISGRTGRKTAKAVAAAKSVDWSCTANELLAMTRAWYSDKFAVMFAGNGSLSVEQVKRVALAEGETAESVMKAFLVNLFNGKGAFPGLLNMPRGFEVKVGDLSFVFPGAAYWDKPETISGDAISGLQFTGGEFFKSLASILLMAKTRGTKTWEAVGAVKTHAKHLLAIEESFGAHRGLKFNLPKGRSLPVSYHFEQGFKVITADRQYKEATKRGEVGAIKFPILMENNFRLYNAEVKTLMAFESDAELELNRFICESVVFVDALSHMSNRDDADGDRLTLFWAKGYGAEEKWSEDKLLACNSAKQQLSYVEDELGSLNTKEINERSVMVWDKADVQPAVEEIVAAKTGVGSETNNLITLTHLIRNKAGYSELANLALDAMGILLQKEVVENMKHSNGRVRFCEYLNLRNKETGLEEMAEAFEKAFELMSIKDDNAAYEIAKIFVELFEEDKRSRGQDGYRWNKTNAVRMAHTATWKNVHHSVYTKNVCEIYNTSFFFGLDDAKAVNNLLNFDGKSPFSFILKALSREVINQIQIVAEVKTAEAEALANGEVVETESYHEVDSEEIIDML